jgi:hypothetical protein
MDSKSPGDTETDVSGPNARPMVASIGAVGVTTDDQHRGGRANMSL